MAGYMFEEGDDVTEACTASGNKKGSRRMEDLESHCFESPYRMTGEPWDGEDVQGEGNIGCGLLHEKLKYGITRDNRSRCVQHVKHPSWVDPIAAQESGDTASNVVLAVDTEAFTDFHEGADILEREV